MQKCIYTYTGRLIFTQQTEHCNKIKKWNMTSSLESSTPVTS